MNYLFIFLNLLISFPVVVDSTKDEAALVALILIIVCALAFLIYSFLNAKGSLEKTAFTLIISGGFGNLIERIISGYVTDYLYLHLGNFSLFVFNFADLLITIGACIIIFLWLSGNEQKD